MTREESNFFLGLVVGVALAAGSFTFSWHRAESICQEKYDVYDCVAAPSLVVPYNKEEES